MFYFMQSATFIDYVLIFRWRKIIKDATNAVEVVTFDYPCKFLSKKLNVPFFSRSYNLPVGKGDKMSPPPKPEKLVDFHERRMREVISAFPGHPLILAGKSYGSR